LVEQRIRNAKVASSIPASGTISNGLNFSGHFFARRFLNKYKGLRLGACVDLPDL